MKLSEVSQITIEKDTERPKRIRFRTSGYYLLFEQMNIDDSFAIPFTTQEEAKKIQAKISTSKRNYAIKHNPNFSGTCRILYTKNEVRFWRDS